jgi:alpha-galactosidase
MSIAGDHITAGPGSAARRARKVATVTVLVLFGDWLIDCVASAWPGSAC